MREGDAQGGGSLRMYRRILVALDGTHTSNLALEEALKVARDQQASVRFLHVVDLDTARLDVIWFEAVKDELRRVGRKILDDAVTRAQQEGVQAETALVDSDGHRLSRVIADEAVRWSAELIVMGTHGRHALEHLWLGSVAEGLLRVAPVPVLLVRGR